MSGRSMFISTHRSSRLANRRLRKLYGTAGEPSTKTGHTKARQNTTIRKPKGAVPYSESGDQEHTLMRDPKKQIRLLYLFPGSNDDDLEFHLSTHDLNLLPRYIAISYTWGEDKDHKIVYFNGTPRHVRPNAHYALWQVRLHHSGSYVWIDSICIGQDNLSEKGPQVAIMADIYKGAALTCACVGPSTDSSDLLVQFIAQLGEVELDDEELHDDSITGRGLRATLLIPFSEFWESWTLRSGVDADVLRAAIFAFVNRLYWKRLWIVQEIASSTEIGVLCGTDQLAWQTVHRLRWLPDVKYSGVDLRQMLPFLDLATIAPDKVIPMSMWPDAAADFQCENALDKVYGLLSVLQWEKQAAPIVPDYTRTLLQLACDVSRHSNIKGIVRIVAALDLTIATENAAALIARRRASPSSGPEEPRGQRSLVRELFCSEVFADSNGLLRCPAIWRKGQDAYQDSIYNQFMNRLDNKISTSDCGWRTMWYDHDVAALICRDAQARDLIGLHDSSGVLIVLRPIDQKHFALIGQGFVLPGFSCFRKDKTHGRIFPLDMSISDEDAVILACQDLLPKDRRSGDNFLPLDWAYDIDARIARLDTRISEQPNPTARIIEDLTPTHHGAGDSSPKDVSTSQSDNGSSAEDSAGWVAGDM